MLMYLAVVCFLLSLSSGSISAQVPLAPQEDKWEFSIFFGVSQLEDHGFLTPIEGGDSKTVNLSYDPGLALGFRITENLGRKIGAEIEYSYVDHSLSFSNLSDVLPTFNVKQWIHKIVYSILAYPLGRKGRVQPFGSFGGGTSFFQIADDSEAIRNAILLKDRWKLAASFGGGVKIPLSGPWGFRVDVRDQITSVPDFGLPAIAPAFQGNSGAGLLPDGLFHNWQVDAGIIYRFTP